MMFDKKITLDALCSIAPDVLQLYMEACKVTPQNPQWHPEGAREAVPHNVYAHTKIVFDRAREHGDPELMMAAFFHDLGKSGTTIPNKNGSWSSPGHEDVSAKLVMRYRDWIEDMDLDASKVYHVVKDHMRIKHEDEMRPGKRLEMQSGKYYDDLRTFTGFDDMSEFADKSEGD